MPRYHISPRTGEPVACKAKFKCPFGDLEADHYSSREEARFYYEQAREKDLLPSFDRGKMKVGSLPKDWRIDKDTMVVPKGVYVLGDPIYTVATDEAAWRDWVELVANEDEGFQRGAFGATVNGYPVVTLQAPGGAGMYSDSHGRTFEVYSNVFGLTSLSLLKKMGMTDEEIKENGTIIQFDEPTVIRSDATVLNFGDNIQLFNDQPIVEDPEEEYEDVVQEEVEDDFNDDSMIEADPYTQDPATASTAWQE